MHGYTSEPEDTPFRALNSSSECSLPCTFRYMVALRDHPAGAAVIVKIRGAGQGQRLGPMHLTGLDRAVPPEHEFLE